MESEACKLLSSLAPVVVGGLLTGVGGAIGAVMAHALSVSREKRNAKRSKLERLAIVAYEFLDWHHRRFSARLFAQKDLEESAPSNELRMLVNLYSPELRSHSAAILKAGINCQKWVNESWKVQQADPAAWAKDSSNLDSYYPLAEELLVTVDNLVEALHKKL